MDTLLRKQFGFAAMGLLFMALALPLFGFQEAKPPSCTKPLKHTKFVERNAREIKVLFDDYLKGTDEEIRVSAKGHQSIEWRCNSCTFLIKSIVPYTRDLPPRVRDHLLRRFSRGPFYREFPDQREKDEYSEEVVTGPILRNAAPGRNVPPEPQSMGPTKGFIAAQRSAFRPAATPPSVEAYPFKATFWVRRPGMPDCELDPHIKTVQGEGPDH